MLRQGPSLAADDVVTILELSTEKMNMHARHETELNKMLSQISTESSKQTSVSCPDQSLMNVLAPVITGLADEHAHPPPFVFVVRIRSPKTKSEVGTKRR